MATFPGQLVSHASGQPIAASVQVDDDWVRIWSGHRRLGAWSLEAVHPERVTVFRFHLTLDNTTYTFIPEDPAAFANEVKAVIDLRPKARFGLADRVRAARAQELSDSPD